MTSESLQRHVHIDSSYECQHVTKPRKGIDIEL